MGCRRWSPDFAFTSILGPRDIKDIELLEMKGPAEKLLNYHRNHPGFTAILHRAIDQVRDYGRYSGFREFVDRTLDHGRRTMSITSRYSK